MSTSPQSNSKNNVTSLVRGPMVHLDLVKANLKRFGDHGGHSTLNSTISQRPVLK